MDRRSFGSYRTFNCLLAFLVSATSEIIACKMNQKNTSDNPLNPAPLAISGTRTKMPKEHVHAREKPTATLAVVCALFAM